MRTMVLLPSFLNNETINLFMHIKNAREKKKVFEILSHCLSKRTQIPLNIQANVFVIILFYL